MTRPQRLAIFVAFALAVAVDRGVAVQSGSQREIQLHYERAKTALSKNQLAEAADEFREVLHLDPNSAEALANLGMIAFKQGSYGQATQFFSVALKLNPSLWDAKAFLGLNRIRLGQVKDGEPLLEQSFRHIRSQALRIEAGVALIEFHQQAKSLDRALNVILDLERSSPNDPEVLYVAYRAYSDLAAQAIAALAKNAPDSARMHQILAQAALTQDDIQTAIVEYRRALEIDPHLPGVHYELGRAILASSREEPARQEAEQEFKTELASNPMDANSEYELGEICQLRSGLELATVHYARALELRADFVDAHLAIAMAKVLTSLARLYHPHPFEGRPRLH